MKLYKNQYGFTMVELAVTLAIVGILFAYAIPAYNEFSLRQKITNESNDLLGDMLYARVTAIKEGQTVTVRSKNNTDWSDGWEIRLDSTVQKIREKQEINRDFVFAGDVGLITFTNLGTAKNIGTIVISHAGTTKTVTLNVALSGMTTLH